MIKPSIAVLILLSLAACGDNAPAGKSTAKLDAVEVEPGTISDSMIILDEASSDGTAVDNSIPDDGKSSSTKSDSPEDAAEESDSEAAGDANNNDPAPTPKKVEPTGT